MVLQTSLGTTAVPRGVSAVITEAEWFHDHEKPQSASICGAALENDTFAQQLDILDLQSSGFFSSN